MRCYRHVKGLSRLTGPELERMCDVLIPGLKLSKGTPKATGVLNLRASFRIRDRKGRIPVGGQTEAPK